MEEPVVWIVGWLHDNKGLAATQNPAQALEFLQENPAAGVWLACGLEELTRADLEVEVDLDSDLAWFDLAWKSYVFGSRYAPRSKGWTATIEHYLLRGVPKEYMLWAVNKVMDLDRVRFDQKFKYFCGICRNYQDSELRFLSNKREHIGDVAEPHGALGDY